MANQSFLQFNSLVNVDMVKIDQNINDDFEMATSKKDNMYATTVLSNSFNDTIDASYFSPEDTIAGAVFFVYKKTPTQKYYQYVCTLSDGDFIVYDYNIINGQYYHYLVSVEIQTSGKPEYLVYHNREFNETIEQYDLVFHKAAWDDFTICNIEETTEEGVYQKVGSVWGFKYNLEGEELTHNTSVTPMDTLGKYSKISTGVRNYDSSSITVLLGDMKEYDQYNIKTEVNINGNGVPIPVTFAKNKISQEFDVRQNIYRYTEKDDVVNPYALEIEKLKRWKEFCSDGELKLLRDRKGNAWIVQILEAPFSNINTYSNYQQTTISFSWQEVEDIDSISIIMVGDN